MGLSTDIKPLKEAIDQSQEILQQTDQQIELIVGKGGEYSNAEGEIDGDYKFARDNLRSIINNGQIVLNELTSIASISESPRAFEVLTNLMKMLTEANKDLLEIQKRVQDLREESGAKTPQNVTNAMFVGSTKDLQEMLKKQQNE